MFKRKPLQSKSEVWMRNIAMGFLIIYMTIFLIIPVVIVIAGSFHQWNPLNQTYNWIGLDINWLFDSKFALPALMVMTIWKDFGYAVILFLSGLLSLPSDCYESASIDGANAWQTFRYITLPLLKPTMLFVVVTSIISYLQAYVPVLVMTTGGPATSTYLSSYLVYDQAFKQYNFGFASAISLFILVLTALFTVISFKVTGAKES